MNLFEFTDYLRDVRKQKRIKSKDLAKSLGVSSDTFSTWERGISFPNLSHTLKWMELLGVTINKED